MDRPSRSFRIRRRLRKGEATANKAPVTSERLPAVASPLQKTAYYRCTTHPTKQGTIHYRPINQSTNHPSPPMFRPPRPTRTVPDPRSRTPPSAGEIRRLLRYLMPYRRYMAVACVGLVGSS